MTAGPTGQQFRELSTSARLAHAHSEDDTGARRQRRFGMASRRQLSTNDKREGQGWASGGKPAAFKRRLAGLTAGHPCGRFARALAYLIRKTVGKRTKCGKPPSTHSSSMATASGITTPESDGNSYAQTELIFGAPSFIVSPNQDFLAGARRCRRPGCESVGSMGSRRLGTARPFPLWRLRSGLRPLPTDPGAGTLLPLNTRNIYKMKSTRKTARHRGKLKKIVKCCINRTDAKWRPSSGAAEQRYTAAALDAHRVMR
jgi:hypothetical protein